MLDFFGGGCEGDESFLDCVVREVNEEIGLYLPPERWLPESRLPKYKSQLANEAKNIKHWECSQPPTFPRSKSRLARKRS